MATKKTTKGKPHALIKGKEHDKELWDVIRAKIRQHIDVNKEWYSQQKMAADIGITPPNFSNFLNGKSLTMNPESLIKAMLIIDAKARERIRMLTPLDSGEPYMIDIPIYMSIDDAMAGNGQAGTIPTSYSRLSGNDPRRTFFLHVSGSHLEPIASHGDDLCICHANTIPDGSRVVYVHNKSLSIRRYHDAGDAVVLHPELRGDSTIEIKKSDLSPDTIFRALFVVKSL